MCWILELNTHGYTMIVKDLMIIIVTQFFAWTNLRSSWPSGDLASYASDVTHKTSLVILSLGKEVPAKQ